MKLLIAYDGSANSKAALDDLPNAGLPASGEATLLSVADAWPHLGEVQFEEANRKAGGWLGSPMVDAARAAAEQARREAAALADEGAQRLQHLLPGWDLQVVSHADAPGWCILKTAEILHADLIVLGAAGRTLLERLMLGSVARSVLTHAACTVRIGRSTSLVPGAGSMPGTGPLRLLVGVDGSADSAAAVAAVAARRWPPGTQAQVVTVNDAFVATALPPDGAPALWSVSESIFEFDSSTHWITQVAHRAADRLTRAGLRTQVEIRTGNPKRVLPEAANDWQAHCVFVGAKGLSRIERFLIGSVSMAVAERCDCSVEVVRRSA